VGTVSSPDDYGRPAAWIRSVLREMADRFLPPGHQLEIDQTPLTVVDSLANAAEVQRDIDGCCVVLKADPIIHVASELLADAATEPHPDGRLWLNGPTLGFGTAGRGLGALTYFLTGGLITYGGARYYVANRIETTP
jgi:hypothetical protein